MANYTISVDSRELTMLRLGLKAQIEDLDEILDDYLETRAPPKAVAEICFEMAKYEALLNSLKDTEGKPNG